jgi:competence protein ComEA
VVHFVTKERIISAVLILTSLIIGCLVGNIVLPKLVAPPSSLDTVTNSEVQSGSVDNLPKCELYVEVSGAVNKPDVYCMEASSLVIDAIKKAQGLNKLYAKRYVSRNINLSELLTPNKKIYIPFQDEIIKENSIFNLKPISESGTSNVSCISINSGTLEELDSLTGIGPATATKIVEGRPYKQLTDLKSVSGIGDSVFSNISKQICL